MTIVFLGDSITQWWEPNFFKQHFGFYDPVNLAVAGYTTKNVIELLELSKLHNLNPELVVLHIGTNNADHGITTGETLEDIQEIINLILKINSDTKILLIGLLPRGLSSSDKYRVFNNEVNKLLEYAKFVDNVYYIDIGNIFLRKDGSISKKIMYDYLHLTEEGYKYFTESISSFLFLLYSSSPTSNRLVNSLAVTTSHPAAISPATTLNTSSTKST
jgi:lysophospholipase L1-like esterase